MQTAILDSSFILTCAKQKIDFFEFLENEGIQALIPEEVLEEVEKVKNSKKKMHFRKDAELAIKIIEKHEFEKISLNSKSVDNGIVKFARKNPEVIVATLDRIVKNRTRNRKILIMGKRKLDFF